MENLYIFNVCGMFCLVKGKNLLIYFPINNTHENNIGYIQYLDCFTYLKVERGIEFN